MLRKRKKNNTRYSGCVSVSAACHARLKAQAKREGVTMAKIVDRGLDAATVLQGALERAGQP